MFEYNDINNSTWFADLVERAYRNSKRSNNRIFVYFKTKEDAEDCIRRANNRNINTTGIMHDLFYEDYRVDILMNWKERRPSKIRRKDEQIL